MNMMNAGLALKTLNNVDSWEITKHAIPIIVIVI